MSGRILETSAASNLGKPPPLPPLEGNVQMTALRIALFGKFQITRHQQPVTGFDARKLQELFGYLLLYRDRLHPHEAVASLLWVARSRGSAPDRGLLWRERSVRPRASIWRTKPSATLRPCFARNFSRVCWTRHLRNNTSRPVGKSRRFGRTRPGSQSSERNS